MSKTTPCLMIEKTVPSGNFVLTGSTTVLDVIEADLADASKDTTLYSPGGAIFIGNVQTSTTLHMDESHSLIGDNTGGYELDSEVDFSRCPVNYTPPSGATTNANTTPQHLQRHIITVCMIQHIINCVLKPLSIDTVRQKTKAGLQFYKAARLLPNYRYRCFYSMKVQPVGRVIHLKCLILLIM